MGAEGEGYFSAVVGQDVQRGFVVNDCGGLLVVVQAFHKLKSQIFAVAQDAETGFGALADFGGVGAEKERGYGNDVVAPDAEVQGYVVAFEAPAPRVFGAGLAENGEIVKFDIAHEGDHTHFFFEGAEDILVFDDLPGLLVGAGGEAGLQQGKGQFALAGVHIAQGQAMAVDGRIVPVHPLAVHILEGGFGLLFGGKAVEESAGGGGHLRGGRRLGLGGCHVGNLPVGGMLLVWSLWAGRFSVNPRAGGVGGQRLSWRRGSIFRGLSAGFGGDAGVSKFRWSG